MTRRLWLVLAVVAAAGVAASVVAVAGYRGRGVSGGRPAAVSVGARLVGPQFRPPPLPPPTPSPSPAFFDPARPVGPGLRAASGSGETLEQAVRASGRDEGAWTQRAAAAFLEMKRTIPRALAPQMLIRKMECYRTACLLEVGYVTRQAFDQTDGAFRAVDGYRRWSAAKGHGPVEVTRGSALKVLWLLANPAPKPR